MWKHLMMVCCLAIGCKTDSNESTGQAGGEPSGGATTTSGARPRSGKIDLDRPRLPSAGGGDSSDEPDEAGRGGRGDPETREQRRKERMARLDSDGDGKISEQERAAARQTRALNLRTRLDTDGDGKLTVDELQTSPLRRFDPGTADADQDGNITVEELDTMLQQRGIGRRGPWGRRGGMGGSAGAPGAPGSAAPAATTPAPL